MLSYLYTISGSTIKGSGRGSCDGEVSAIFDFL